ncbi:MAG: hypothetical protein CVV25_00910 [Ignavibacteriae bacterium HGW-Ignavibacteriae-4]|jgi:hypothetical protein|nr:MAG: hypothetical protein CVV25_00910 [Ignavibacteriae bacterium HGW-Ignavibacteriae-4]
MKKYIIVALILAAVWGCSDDKITTPDLEDKDTVGKTFVTIEGLENYIETTIILDTLGDASKLDKLCRMGDKFDIVAKPTISYGGKLLYMTFDTSQVATEVFISIETAKVSSEIRDSVIARFGYFPEHKEFKNVEWFRDTLDNSSLAGYSLDAFTAPPGAYIIRVKRTGISDRCVPFIRLGDENEE